jgi:hypothetical protein
LFELFARQAHNKGVLYPHSATWSALLKKANEPPDLSGLVVLGSLLNEGAI